MQNDLFDQLSAAKLGGSHPFNNSVVHNLTATLNAAFPKASLAADASELAKSIWPDKASLLGSSGLSAIINFEYPKVNLTAMASELAKQIFPDGASILGTTAASALTAAIGPLSQRFSDLMPSRDALRTSAMDSLLGYDPRQVDYSAFTKHLEAVRSTAIEALRDAMPRFDLPTEPFSSAAIFQKAEKELYTSLQRKLETIGIVPQEGKDNVIVDVQEDQGQTTIEEVLESSSYEPDYLPLLNHEMLRAEIESLKTQLDSPKALQAFMNIINLVAFALALIGWYNDFFGVGNSTVLATINNRFDRLENKIDHRPHLALAVEKLMGLPRLELRTARRSVTLLSNDRRNAAIKTRIVKGQLVMTLDSIQKHLLVTYIDMNTGEHHTGYVLKKYFKRLVR